MATEAERELWKTDADAAFAEAERRIAEAFDAGGAELDLEGLNALRDIPDSLHELPQLQILYLDDTSVSDLSTLSHVPQLQRLDLIHTSVSDLSALTHVPQLLSLYLSNTPVSDLSALSHVPQLWDLYLSNTPVSDLSALSHVPQLQSLVLSDTSFSDLSALSHVPQLRDLYLSNTPVSDLSALSHVPQLQSLVLSDTSVSDLSALSHVPQLQHLDLRSTSISDLSPLSHVPQLQSLDLRNTSVSDPRPILNCPLLRNDPEILGLHLRNSLAAEQIDGLGDAVKIDDPKERGKAIFEILEALPPWPEPLDGSGGEEPAQSEQGQGAATLPDGRVGLVDEAIAGLSEQAKGLLDDLRQDASDLARQCAGLAGNIHSDLRADIEIYLAALDAPLELNRLFRAAKKLRRVNRAEQARANDPVKERYFDEDVGEGLKDLVSGHNAFVLEVPELSTRDQAGIDPAERFAEGASAVAADVQQVVEATETGFDETAQLLRDDLRAGRGADGPSERDWSEAAYSLGNLLTVHTVRAWHWTKRAVKSKEGKSAITNSAISAAVYGVAGASVGLGCAGVLSSAFLYRNEELILSFLDKHPRFESLKTVVALNNAGIRKVLAALPDGHSEKPK